MHYTEYDTRLAAYAVVTDDEGRVLLALWNEGARRQWTLPGGGLELHERAEEGVVGFAVPTATEGFAAREVRLKLSLRASATGEITLDDVRVPESARLSEARGLKAPLSCLTEARFGIIWGALGAARDCLETALAYAGSREQFGRPIAGFQLTQAKLADIAWTALLANAS